MKATKTATEKISVFKNDYLIDKEKSNVEFWLQRIEELLQHYDAMDLNFSDEELNALIRGNFSESTILRLAQDRAVSVPHKQRAKLMEDFASDCSLYRDVFSTVYLYVSPYIQVKDGKAFIADGTFEQIEKLHTVYISDQKSIDLYKRHNELISELNALSDQINSNAGTQINSSHLIRFDAIGKTYRNDQINYGK